MKVPEAIERQAERAFPGEELSPASVRDKVRMRGKPSVGEHGGVFHNRLKIKCFHGHSKILLLMFLKPLPSVFIQRLRLYHIMVVKQRTEG